MSDKKYSGHITTIGGERIPLSEDDARKLFEVAERAREARATTLPTAVDALRALSAAEERLRELGWWRGGGLRVRRGDVCAVAQQGSTGIWSGRMDYDGKYVHFGDSVASPQKLFLKPLSDLTDEERSHMEACDKREAEAYRAMISRFSTSEPQP